MAETPRKKEGLQRVQIGLTGLAGVILLVGLANIVINKASSESGATSLQSAQTVASGIPDSANNVENGQPNEPLAELGVTPASNAPLASAPTAGQVVPDLEPDPNLKRPMDRDPQPQPAR